MSGFGFDTLALLAIIGMAGPLLASLPRFQVPVIIGELVAGLVVGRTGFGIVDHTDATFTLLANIGFALVMFVVGTHVPVRDKTLRAAIPKALLRAVTVGAVAAVLGVVLARAFGTGHARAVRRADGVVLGCTGAAGDRLAEAQRTSGAVGDHSDRDRRRNLDCVAAVSDQPDTGAARCARRLGGRGRRGGAVLPAAHR